MSESVPSELVVELTVADAVRNLSQSVNETSFIADALAVFRGSTSAFINCVRSCRQNPSTDAPSAACVILYSLFEAVTSQETAEKVERFQFDEGAVILRECDALLKAVRLFQEDTEKSLSATASACGIPLQTTVIPCHSVNVTDDACWTAPTNTESIHGAIERLNALKKTVNMFFIDCTRIHRNRVIASVEIEKRLSLCIDHWDSFTASQKQQLGECVAAEVQTRLERRWMTQFMETLRPLLDGLSQRATAAAQPSFTSFSVAQTSSVEFEHKWLREWNKRREIVQDKLSLCSNNIIATANNAARLFPAVTHADERRDEQLLQPQLPFSSPENTTDGVLFSLMMHDKKPLPQALSLQAMEPFTSAFLAERKQSNSRPVSRSSATTNNGSLVRQREAIRRPVAALSRVLEACDPPPILTVVNVSPELPAGYSRPTSSINSTSRRMQSSPFSKPTLHSMSATPFTRPPSAV